MESNLLGVLETEKYIVRIFTGPATDTPEKRQALFEAAAINFLKAIRKNYPDIYKTLGKPVSEVDKE